MQQYKDLLQDILTNGIKSDDRTGTGTLSVFGRTLKFDLSQGFPLVTIKKTFWKGVLVELLWMLRGETNIKFLKNLGVNIWDQWADKSGDLGPVYGAQLRNYNSVDQLKTVIDQIKTNPNSRRILWTLWRPDILDKQALPPCHGLVVQFYVRNGKLSCSVYQRSADCFLGLPFDIASYACLLHLIANECGLIAHELVYTIGDAHLYLNHITETKECLNREPKELPNITVYIKPGELLDFIGYSHLLNWDVIRAFIMLNNYEAHPKINVPVSV
jgi:thymidylate synthase